MRSRMIAIAAGFAAAGWQPQLIPVSGCISIALILLLYVGISHSCSNSSLDSSRFCSNFYSRFYNHFRIPLVLMLSAFVYASLWGHWQLLHRLGDEWQRSDWQVTGTVQGLPRHSEQSVRFELAVTAARFLPADTATAVRLPPATPRRIQLAWYDPAIRLEAGQVLTAQVRLKPPHSLINPHGFDYERWMLSRGIDATGYVRAGDSAVLTAGKGGVSQTIAELREQINRQIQHNHQDTRVQALLMAVTTGYKQHLSQEDWALLRQSGTLHLAVISGLHIGFMALLGWGLGRLFSWLRWPFSYYYPYLGSLGLAGAYVLIAGAEIPSQRAFIMLAVLLLSGMRQWYVDPWSRWWLALVAVLVYSPLAIWETGFWLSFSAVAVLIWLAQQRWRWYELIQLQLWLLVGMLPLYILFFSGVALIAPLVNLIAIPLFTLFVPLIFLNLLLTGVGISSLLGLECWLAERFWQLVDLAAGQQWSYQVPAQMDSIALLSCLLAMLILLAPPGAVPKRLALVFLAPLVFRTQWPAPEPGAFQATVYDVGQGLAVLIEVGDYKLLYDTGPAYRSGGTAFARAVLPDMQARGITRLDHLVLSHDDNDHAGGAEQVLDQLDVVELYSSFHFSGNGEGCYAGKGWQVGDVNFSFLSGTEGVDDNDRSCVLMVENGHCSLLIPGDIHQTRELTLLPQLPTTLNWLIAAHHGSRSSTSEQFLQGVQVERLIFSAGYANAYNHPHPDVQERAARLGIQHVNTAEDGAVILNASTTHGCSERTMRQESKRFWR